MPTFGEYLDIAEECYANKKFGEPHLGRGWKVQKWEWANWYGDGFQGGVFVRNKGYQQVVIGFSGTKGGVTTAPVSQNTANLRIGVNVIPNMAGGALDLVRWAKKHNPGASISIVGHSLGGGLAQVVGNWAGVPFVSLNGPGMKTHLKASAFNVFKPRQMARSIRSETTEQSVGICLTVANDFVGTFGSHVGEYVELGSYGGTRGRPHDIDTIRSLVEDKGWSDKSPSVACAAWPFAA